jgi:hypothetical protein
MQHTQIDHEDDRDEGILLGEVDQSYWLLDGEAHLNAMMSNQDPYPRPVRCLRLQSVAELNDLMPDGVGVSALWAIHPAVIERLKQNDELTVVDLVKTR